MRKFALMGLATLAGAGVGLLMFTQKGRALTAQLRQRMASGGGEAPRDLVEEVLAQPHPDTAMAQAFEEAVTS